MYNEKYNMYKYITYISSSETIFLDLVDFLAWATLYGQVYMMYKRIEINTYTAEDLALEVTWVEDLLGGIMMKFNGLSK